VVVGRKPSQAKEIGLRPLSTRCFLDRQIKPFTQCLPASVAKPTRKNGLFENRATTLPAAATRPLGPTCLTHSETGRNLSSHAGSGTLDRLAFQNGALSMPASVTTWIGKLREGNTAAAQQLWERYYGQLLDFARHKLRGSPLREADEEDVALSAFHSFCQSAARFPRLNSRDDLWQILIMLTARKASHQRRRQQAQKRGGAMDTSGSVEELDEIIGSEPTPQFAAMIAEEFQTLLNRLPDEGLRQIARLRLEDYTSAEIAGLLQCSERTVERRLALIRAVWEETSQQ
jgi:RNA polymerase sigma factor (sigma-70 family)